MIEAFNGEDRFKYLMIENKRKKRNGVQMLTRCADRCTCKTILGIGMKGLGTV